MRTRSVWSSAAPSMSMDEANLVRLLRDHYPGFDRRYSILAWN